MALFNVDIWHKPGKENIVPDALSRKHQLRLVYVGESKLQKEVRLTNRRDAFAKDVATLALGSRPRLRGLQGCRPRGRKPESQGKGIARVWAKRKPES